MINFSNGLFFDYCFQLTQVVGECRVTFPMPGKRQAPQMNRNVSFIPFERMQEFRNLNMRGFTYDHEGICDYSIR